jgi:hypothetical protein
VLATPSAARRATGLSRAHRASQGIAVEVRTDKGPHVQWLPANTLPSGTKERLASLFKIKPAWRLDEIEAYLDDVLEEEVGRTKEQILIQHARQMKDDHGEMLFVERR